VPSTSEKLLLIKLVNIRGCQNGEIFKPKNPDLVTPEKGFRKSETMA
jgi:hypothetical protein